MPDSISLEMQEQHYMIELRKDPYLQRYWPNCPEAVLTHIETNVWPIASLSQDPCETDVIMKEAIDFEWYRVAFPSDQQQFHKLIGHVVRIARNYEVARLPSGNPKKLLSERGPHRTFTEQVPRRTPS